MSRWLSKDVFSIPLGKIEEEISALEYVSLRDRSIYDTERLADLREARRRILGERRTGGCGGYRF